jgi:cell division protein FtsB
MATQAKTIEAKKDEFRSYLEKTGVVDQLTKVLVSLYEETDKPTNPIEFIKRNMSAPEEIDQDNLKNEYLKLKEENEKLRQRVTDLQKQIESLKGDEGN